MYTQPGLPRPYDFAPSHQVMYPGPPVNPGLPHGGFPEQQSFPQSLEMSHYPSERTQIPIKQENGLSGEGSGAGSSKSASASPKIKMSSSPYTPKNKLKLKKIKSVLENLSDDGSASTQPIGPRSESVVESTSGGGSACSSVQKWKPTGNRKWSEEVPLPGGFTGCDTNVH